MIIRCYPTGQFILTALWLESVLLFSTILGLNIAALYMPPFSAIAVYIIVHILHSWLVNDLRQLRTLELITLSADGPETEPLEMAGDKWLFIWPKAPLFVAAMPIFHHPIAEIPWLLQTSVIVISVCAAPAFLYVLDALLWRVISSHTVLKTRFKGNVRVSVVSSYYAAIESVVWQTVGEDPVNRSYALLLLTKFSYRAALAAFSAGITGSYQDLPKIFADCVTNSWITIFGACWIGALVYQCLMQLWINSVELIQTEAQARELSLLKYDLCGYLTMVCSLANITSATNPFGSRHILRLLNFFAIYKLWKLSNLFRDYAQRRTLDGNAGWKLYLRAVVDGSLVPMGLGLFFSWKLWQMPFDKKTIFSNVWLADRSILFPVDFEVWMHGETLLVLGDLLLLGCSAVINVVASYAHLVKNHAPKFWHIVLQKTDWTEKFWMLCVREILGAVLHGAVITLLMDDRTDVVFITVIYLSRLMDAVSALHHVILKRIATQIFCWSRCVIHALESPDERSFAVWNDVCSICRLEEEDRLTICSFPCGHHFHRECIEEWLKREMRCPMCMRKIWFENGDLKMA